MPCKPNLERPIGRPTVVRQGPQADPKAPESGAAALLLPTLLIKGREGCQSVEFRLRALGMDFALTRRMLSQLPGGKP